MVGVVVTIEDDVTFVIEDDVTLVIRSLRVVSLVILTPAAEAMATLASRELLEITRGSTMILQHSSKPVLVIYMVYRHASSLNTARYLVIGLSYVLLTFL